MSKVKKASTARIRKMCQHQRCDKAAVSGGTQFCVSHGGGKRCQHQGCDKAAASGGTQFCVAHGGGKRCQHQGCDKAAVSGGTQFCKAHGGGNKTCQAVGGGSELVSSFDPLSLPVGCYFRDYCDVPFPYPYRGPDFIWPEPDQDEKDAPQNKHKVCIGGKWAEMYQDS